MRMLVKLVRKGRVTIEEAAKDAGMTVEEFEKVLKILHWGEASDKTPVYVTDVIVTYQVLPEKSA